MRTLILTIVVFLLSLCSTTLPAQKLSDTMFSKMSRMEMGDHFQKKSRGLKTGGFTLMGVGVLMVAAGTSIAVNDLFNERGNAETGAGLFFLGIGSMAASYPILAAGARNKGKAEMLYMNPDPEQTRKLTETYTRKARTNSIIAWSLLGSGFIIPLALQQTTNSYGEKSQAVETVSAVSSMCIYISIPFFMEAAKHKGRVSILTRTERIAASTLKGTGTHRSIGISIPISK